MRLQTKSPALPLVKSSAPQSMSSFKMDQLELRAHYQHRFPKGTAVQSKYTKKSSQEGSNYFKTLPEEGNH